jgi:ligand-binding sensor domain-containing protein
LKAIAILLLLLFSISTYGQLNQFNQTNFTIEDGLPSNECHDAIQDPKGYIWIATDRGLVKYDGYEFKTYGISEGLGDISCLKLTPDNKGNIWISTVGKKIYCYLINEDKIVPYKYQIKLDHYLKSSLNILVEEVDNQGSLLFNVRWFGFVKIDEKGNVKILSQEQKNYYTLKGDKGIYITQTGQNNAFKVEDGKSDINNLLGFNPKEIIRYNYFSIHNINQSEAVISFNKKRYFYFKEKLQTFHEDIEIKDLEVLSDGQILTAHIFEKGLRSYENLVALKKNKFTQVLDETSITNIFKDRQNNLLITTMNKGVFYFRKSNFYSIKKFEGSSIKELTTKESNLLFIKDKREVIEYNAKDNGSSKLFTAELEANDVLYLSKQKKVVLGELVSRIFDQNGKAEILSTFKKNIALNRLIQIDSTTIVGLSSTTFSLFDKNSMKLKYSSFDKFDYKRFLTACKAIDNKLFLGSNDGLYTFDGINLSKIDNPQPIFSYRINDILPYNDKYVLASLGGGIAIWDGNKEVKTITKANGLVSDNIERLYIDKNKVIYACLKNGFSIVTISGNDIKIQNYTKGNGLPSAMINDIILHDKKIFIACEKGLYYLQNNNEVEKNFQPFIESIATNDKYFKSNILPTSFNSNENNIVINYKTLDFARSNGLEYSYTIDNINWVTTTSTKALLTGLTPKSYTFSLRSRNMDGEWSPITKYGFTIHPAWWQTIWFRLFLGSLLAYGAYVLYQKRMKKLSKENEAKYELLELERSALQAQMNPHFIYNCLNSIQNFIMKNDKLKAMDYLSNFAKLIRQNLSASASSNITLDQEISILENYLHLEQMRFDHSFDFKINVDPNLDMHMMKIPPLLIQPFVENAILHGIKDVNYKGLIQIDFLKKEDKINIIIKDNGIGLKEKSKSVNSHKSMGVAITKKRLDYLNANNIDSSLVYNDNIEIGTEVSITIFPIV